MFETDNDTTAGWQEIDRRLVRFVCCEDVEETLVLFRDTALPLLRSQQIALPQRHEGWQLDSAPDYGQLLSTIATTSQYTFYLALVLRLALLGRWIAALCRSPQDAELRRWQLTSHYMLFASAAHTWLDAHHLLCLSIEELHQVPEDDSPALQTLLKLYTPSENTCLQVRDLPDLLSVILRCGYVLSDKTNVGSGAAAAATVASSASSLGMGGRPSLIKPSANKRSLSNPSAATSPMYLHRESSSKKNNDNTHGEVITLETIEHEIRQSEQEDLIHIFSKSIPHRCQVRETVSIVAQKCLQHPNIFCLFKALLAASFLGIYDHCRQRPEWRLRNDIYRFFFFALEDPRLIEAVAASRQCSQKQVLEQFEDDYRQRYEFSDQQLLEHLGPLNNRSAVMQLEYDTELREHVEALEELLSGVYSSRAPQVESKEKQEQKNDEPQETMAQETSSANNNNITVTKQTKARKVANSKTSSNSSKVSWRTRLAHALRHRGNGSLMAGMMHQRREAAGSSSVRRVRDQILYRWLSTSVIERCSANSTRRTRRGLPYQYVVNERLREYLRCALSRMPGLRDELYECSDWEHWQTNVSACSDQFRQRTEQLWMQDWQEKKRKPMFLLYDSRFFQKNASTSTSSSSSSSVSSTQANALSVPIKPVSNLAMPQHNSFDNAVLACFEAAFDQGAPDLPLRNQELVPIMPPIMHQLMERIMHQNYRHCRRIRMTRQMPTNEQEIDNLIERGLFPLLLFHVDPRLINDYEAFSAEYNAAPARPLAQAFVDRVLGLQPRHHATYQFQVLYAYFLAIHAHRNVYTVALPDNWTLAQQRALRHNYNLRDDDPLPVHCMRLFLCMSCQTIHSPLTTVAVRNRAVTHGISNSMVVSEAQEDLLWRQYREQGQWQAGTCSLEAIYRRSQEIDAASLLHYYEQYCNWHCDTRPSAGTDVGVQSSCSISFAQCLEQVQAQEQRVGNWGREPNPKSAGRTPSIDLILQHEEQFNRQANCQRRLVYGNAAFPWLEDAERYPSLVYVCGGKQLKQEKDIGKMADDVHQSTTINSTNSSSSSDQRARSEARRRFLFMRCWQRRLHEYEMLGNALFFYGRMYSSCSKCLAFMAMDEGCWRGDLMICSWCWAAEFYRKEMEQEQEALRKRKQGLYCFDCNALLDADTLDDSNTMQVYDDRIKRYVTLSFCPLSMASAQWAFDSPLLLTLKGLSSGMARDWLSQLKQKQQHQEQREQRTDWIRQLDEERRRFLKKSTRKKNVVLKRKAGSLMNR